MTWTQDLAVEILELFAGFAVRPLSSQEGIPLAPKQWLKSLERAAARPTHCRGCGRKMQDIRRLRFFCRAACRQRRKRSTR